MGITIRKINWIDATAIFFCFLFFLLGMLVSLNRFWQYEVSMVDFGQYDQALWHISRFQEPITYHFLYGKINVLGDHVTPSVFLLAPLYWITNRSEIILIAQAFIVALSGFFLYDLSKHALKHRFLSLSILLCYFLFVGLQNAVITEFHELTVMTLPLMLTFWSIMKNKKITYFIALIIMLGCKEVTFILGVAIGIALFFLKKEWRKQSVWTIGISLLWGILAFKVIIPYFNHGQYLYANNLPPGILPKVFALVDDPLKRRTLFYSFFSFFFLPVFAPAFWLAMLQDYATRFIPVNFITRWDLGLHYNAQSAVLLAVSSVFGLKYILKFPIIKKFSVVLAVLLILNSFVLFRFILHGPLLLAINPAFYHHSKDFTFLDSMVAKIPRSASVMTQNDLATRFTHQDVRLLSVYYPQVKPDYILVDIRQGQNPNDFFGSKYFFQIVQQLLTDPTYEIVYKTNDQYIFKRK